MTWALMMRTLFAKYAFTFFKVIFCKYRAFHVKYSQVILDIDKQSPNIYECFQ